MGHKSTGVGLVVLFLDPEPTYLTNVTDASVTNVTYIDGCSA